MIRGNILNIFTGEIYPGEVQIESGFISCVKKIKGDYKGILIPGLIDAHIHIESSMLTPASFAQAVVPHGTVGVVADPHEIANVMGIKGIEYMINDSKKVPLSFSFTAPSCVPATAFETSGAKISAKDIEYLMKKKEIVALGEMMNFPGIIRQDPEVMQKIYTSQSFGKPIDGHAPLLSGLDLCRYIRAGISTDHECCNQEEALEKIQLGMKIMIREGSSAQNMEELIKVGGEFLVSDDIHPQDLAKGHLDLLVQKAIKLGMDPLDAIEMVTINPANHYSLPMGAISPGKKADFIIVDNLDQFNVQKVYIGGKLVAKNGKPLFKISSSDVQSSFDLKRKNPQDFNISCSGSYAKVRVIGVIEGQIITYETEADLEIKKGIIQPAIDQDILKISVLERYGGNKISHSFVKGFGIQEGALASSVAHDSHNIVVVGTNAEEMAKCVEILRNNGGGLAAVSNSYQESLPLPIAGLMTIEPVSEVIKTLKNLHQQVKEMGCQLESPFMSMSFLSLLVIPQLKLSDLGLFDVNNFEFVPGIKEVFL